jgi:hypothetical protein
MMEYITISAMAILRFPVEIGESEERDRIWSAMINELSQKDRAEYLMKTKYKIGYRKNLTRAL